VDAALTPFPSRSARRHAGHPRSGVETEVDIIAATLEGEKKSAGEIVPAFICTNLFIASWLP
jgi:hypothetical protein